MNETADKPVKINGLHLSQNECKNLPEDKRVHISNKRKAFSNILRAGDARQKIISYPISVPPLGKGRQSPEKC